MSYIFSFIHKKRFYKKKNSIFPPKYMRYGENDKNKIVRFKKIYNFRIDYFFTGVISFVYW